VDVTQFTYVQEDYAYDVELDDINTSHWDDVGRKSTEQLTLVQETLSLNPFTFNYTLNDTELLTDPGLEEWNIYFGTDHELTYWGECHVGRVENKTSPVLEGNYSAWIDGWYCIYQSVGGLEEGALYLLTWYTYNGGDAARAWTSQKDRSVVGVNRGNWTERRLLFHAKATSITIYIGGAGNDMYVDNVSLRKVEGTALPWWVSYNDTARRWEIRDILFYANGTGVGSLSIQGMSDTLVSNNIFKKDSYDHTVSGTASSPTLTVGNVYNVNITNNEFHNITDSDVNAEQPAINMQSGSTIMSSVAYWFSNDVRVEKNLFYNAEVPFKSYGTIENHHFIHNKILFDDEYYDMSYRRFTTFTGGMHSDKFHNITDNFVYNVVSPGTIQRGYSSYVDIYAYNVIYTYGWIDEEDSSYVDFHDNFFVKIPDSPAEAAYWGHWYGGILYWGVNPSNWNLYNNHFHGWQYHIIKFSNTVITNNTYDAFYGWSIYNSSGSGVVIYNNHYEGDRLGYNMSVDIATGYEGIEDRYTLVDAGVDRHTISFTQEEMETRETFHGFFYNDNVSLYNFSFQELRDGDLIVNLTVVGETGQSYSDTVTIYDYDGSEAVEISSNHSFVVDNLHLGGTSMLFEHNASNMRVNITNYKPYVLEFTAELDGVFNLTITQGNFTLYTGHTYYLEKNGVIIGNSSVVNNTISFYNIANGSNYTIYTHRRVWFKDEDTYDVINGSDRVVGILYTEEGEIVKEFETTTGYIDISPPFEPRYVVLAYSNDSYPNQRRILIDVGEKVIFDMYLLKQGRGTSNVFIVHDSSFGNTIEGATVAVYHGSLLIDYVKTDADGRAISYLDPYKLYKIYVDREGYANTSFELYGFTLETHEIFIELLPVDVEKIIKVWFEPTETYYVKDQSLPVYLFINIREWQYIANVTVIVASNPDLLSIYLLAGEGLEVVGGRLDVFNFDLTDPAWCNVSTLCTGDNTSIRWRVMPTPLQDYSEHVVAMAIVHTRDGGMLNYTRAGFFAAVKTALEGLFEQLSKEQRDFMGLMAVIIATTWTAVYFRLTFRQAGYVAVIAMSAVIVVGLWDVKTAVAPVLVAIYLLIGGEKQ
jgi:hypothetical protein